MGEVLVAKNSGSTLKVVVANVRVTPFVSISRGQVRSLRVQEV